MFQEKKYGHFLMITEAYQEERNHSLSTIVQIIMNGSNNKRTFESNQLICNNVKQHQLSWQMGMVKIQFKNFLSKLKPN